MMWFLIIIALTFLLINQAFIGLDSSIGIIRFFGLAGMLLISISLAIRPITLFFPKWAELIEPRRAVGLSGFIFILAHAILVSAIYFGFDPNLMQGQINLMFGSIALVILIPVALSSTDVANRVLGNNKWKAIQRLTYIAFIFALIHFILTSMTLSSGNFASIFVLIIANITILLQIAGFVIKLKKTKSNI